MSEHAKSLLAGLIGYGIQASLTPSMHEQEGAAQGRRYVYRKIDLQPLGLDAAALPELLTAAERMGFDGLNITFPCKQAVIPLLDELSTSAYEQADPLDGAQPSGVVGQPNNYHLYVSRGKHGTVAGNTTHNGLYNPDHRSEDANSVPRLIYKLSRAYLTQWGTVFAKRCRVQNENAKQLRARIHTKHGDYDSMAAGGEFRTSMLPTRQNVRRDRKSVV